jgi:hypothetical protein
MLLPGLDYTRIQNLGSIHRAVFSVACPIQTRTKTHTKTNPVFADFILYIKIRNIDSYAVPCAD